MGPVDPPGGASLPARLPVASVMPSGLDQMILFTHQRNAEKEIVGPNETGVFPDSVLGSVPPVVADATVLSRDVLRACKQQQHTVLVNAVNSRMMRLYCARHVIDALGRVRTPDGRTTGPRWRWLEGFHKLSDSNESVHRSHWLPGLNRLGRDQFTGRDDQWMLRRKLIPSVCDRRIDHREGDALHLLLAVPLDDLSWRSPWSC